MTCKSVGLHALLFMSFGIEKYKLLISGRPKSIKAVEDLLESEPNLLTFFGNPVSTVKDCYVHIGVPQATKQQSQTAAKYRMSKGKDISYKLIDFTINSLLEINPFQTEKCLQAIIDQHLWIMVYGTDFKGWSTLARLTYQKNGVPDPLDIMIDPWRPDRWGLYFKYAVTIHCNAKLRCEAAEMDSRVCHKYFK